MIRFFTALLALSLMPAVSPAAPASLDLLRRATNPNPTLTTYTAKAHLSATLHAILPVHKEVDGTVYYVKPKRKIVFQDLKGALARFKDLAASAPTYEEAMAKYTITPLTDDGSISSYLLVPKDTGSRVKSVTVGVDDTRALIVKAAWAYKNGGSLTFDQQYMDVTTFHLAAKTDISAHFPGYSVGGTLTFSDYQPNVPVSPSVFASP